MDQRSFWKVPEAFIWNAINSAGLSQIQGIYKFLYVTWSYSFRGLLSTASSRAWTLASTRYSCVSSHKLCGINLFLKQSATELASSSGRYFRPEEQRITVCALGLPLLMREFAMCYILWEATSQLLPTSTIEGPLPEAFLWLISWHSKLPHYEHDPSFPASIFVASALMINRRSRPEWSFFMNESVIFVVDNLYSNVLFAVRSRAALSASNSELISILGDINSEAMLWNRFHFVIF
jgi:hypothetical protein